MPKDNKIHFGPVWDFDLGWMNADFCEAYTTAGWAWEINYKCPDGTVPFWWGENNPGYHIHGSFEV